MNGLIEAGKENSVAAKLYYCDCFALRQGTSQPTPFTAWEPV